MTGKELADALVRAAALIRQMADVGSLELEIMPRATLRVRSANAERQKRHRKRNERNADNPSEGVTNVTPPVTDVTPKPVTNVTGTVTNVTPPAQDPPSPPHTPPLPPVSKTLPTQGNSSLSLLLPDQPESEGSPRARARRQRARTGLPEDLRPSSAAWSPEQAARLQAIGRDLLREDEQFLAHHRAAGTLSASWANSRATWVCNAEKGYGAPRAQATQLGMVTQIRSRNPAQENIDRQLERLAAARAEEERKAVS